MSRGMAGGGWRFWIDRGGTFTDIVAVPATGPPVLIKRLSENKGQYEDAAIAGIREVLGLAAGEPIPAGAIAEVKMGTTVATNALLERQGEPPVLVVNRGFGGLLAIGRQARPRLFDLDIRKPEPLAGWTVEVAGRVSLDGKVLEPLDGAAARAELVAAREAGATACAIALLHAWKHPEMERAVAEIARELGFVQVSMSHDVSAEIGLVSRASTTVVDAYLSPVLRRYVDQVSAALGETPLGFMQSAGGLADAAVFAGKDALLSGPAGGIVGMARTAVADGFPQAVGFDMGGTSTDVSVHDGAYARVFETEIAGVPLNIPMLDIHTVAAGGGSVLLIEGGRLRVGPESAGSDPGPAAYRKGGPATVTDANVLLGRIQPAHFPRAFGPGGDQPIDPGASREAFAPLVAAYGEETGEAISAEALAEAFLDVAVSNMARATRALTLDRGVDLEGFALQSFGGAGGQHACRVADALGLETVLVHPFAGGLSALGIGLADTSTLARRSVEQRLNGGAIAAAGAWFNEVAPEQAALLGEPDEVVARVSIALRYAGSDTALDVPFVAEMDRLVEAFEAAHRARFGFVSPRAEIEVASLMREAIAPGPALPDVAAGASPVGERGTGQRARMWTGGEVQDVPLYLRGDVPVGVEIDGPALVIDDGATTVVEPGWRVRRAPSGTLILGKVLQQAPVAEGEGESGGARDVANDVDPDPMRLTLFNNMFMAIAERMGGVLRDTASSVNIKERLDFSCALFDAGGGLIANAPHMPVHLGAMGESVRAVLRARAGSLRPGDMVALNNPYNGGTHLPDVTVIAPVFAEDGQTIRFFVGNRGHHADIGGLTPGSTPPHATRLDEEGVVLDDLLVCRDGVFLEDAFRAALASGPYPARSPGTNVSDIRAQIAANQAGIDEINALLTRYGWPMVSAYAGHVMDNAEESVRRVIDRLADGEVRYTLDDGAEIHVAIEVDRAGRSAVLDFTGTSDQRPGNFNAPPAVTRAAALYVFRCLVADDLPLNEGCLRPLTLVIPEGSLLSPRDGAAVVAGNTEISQALCNALLLATGGAASSQGTMNNLLLGNSGTQYYETICGGAGAGPSIGVGSVPGGFAGAHAVHTHMTNTRITDPEILEDRYPMRVTEFSIRTGSGGEGRQRGGDGVVREIEALASLTLSLVSSSRSAAPPGLGGGGPGAVGRQWIIRADGRTEALEGVASAELLPGDRIRIETPGGAGWGAV